MCLKASRGAIPMELGLFKRLLLGNYLLYGVVGNLFYRCLEVAGFSGHAYTALQAMDSVIGAAGLAVFYFILRSAGTDRYFSACWTVVLGVSLGYSLWSMEAENYILSTFLLALNFLFLILYHRTRKVPVWLLGLLQGLAIFGHLVNGLFILVAAWFFWRTESETPERAFTLPFGGVRGRFYRIWFGSFGFETVRSSGGFGLDPRKRRRFTGRNRMAWILVDAGGGTPMGRYVGPGDRVAS